jgi:hypothetical protein
MDQIIARITPNDRVFIHWYYDAVHNVLRKLPPTTPVYLMFWGGDMIHTEHFRKFNFDPLTYEYVKKHEPPPKSSMLKQFLRQTLPGIFPAQEIRSRRELMSRVQYFCHWNRLDLPVVTEVFGGSPVFKDFFYEASIDKIEFIENKNNGGPTKIWIGNSETSSNNHLDAMDQLKKFASENIKIIAPLSYGLRPYGDMVDKTGREMFGSKWIGLRDFIPLDQYLVMQREVGVVIMNHNRTQAGFNVFGFVKMGKKLYMKKQSTIYQFLQSNGIVLFDATEIRDSSFDEFSRPLTRAQAESNSRILGELFSEERKIDNYRKLLAS